MEALDLKSQGSSCGTQFKSYLNVKKMFPTFGRTVESMTNPMKGFVSQYTVKGGPGSVVDISDKLRAERSGDRIPVGGEIFRTCPNRLLGPTSLLYSGYWVFPGGKERPGRDADPSPPSSAVVMKG